jgi:hypothetical protein
MQLKDVTLEAPVLSARIPSSNNFLSSGITALTVRTYAPIISDGLKLYPS